MNKTFGALDAGKQAAFTQDLLTLMGAATVRVTARWCCRASTSKS